MSPGLVLAFDTATPLATSALVRDGEVLGERTSRAAAVLADADELLRDGRLRPRRPRRARRRHRARAASPASASASRPRAGLALALGLPGRGCLDARRARRGPPAGALPVIDARRREVFTLRDGVPVAVRPAELDFEPGSGARRRRRRPLPAGARGGRRRDPARPRPRPRPARPLPRLARTRLRATPTSSSRSTSGSPMRRRRFA